MNNQFEVKIVCIKRFLDKLEMIQRECHFELVEKARWRHTTDLISNKFQ